ncbi:hypothetical protein B0H17DRAFT_1273993 [Mycena rosella]|uniref:Uncharacterized protein n=1 Tax=Mycena rosella TaxID=1033263 RepID=A0AAD7GYP9_MYCRO|nr:hypothetical protein B0H17DRAFT_1273993 [Mycena rosella]
MGMEEANAYPLLGSWINCMLFMLEIVLMVKYFRTSRPLFHRIGVAAIFACDTVCTIIAICIEVYTYILVSPCEAVFASVEERSIVVILFATYATASLEQFFLCSLYFVLTKKRWHSAFLVTTIALHRLAGIIVCVGDFDPNHRNALGLFILIGQMLNVARIGAISCAGTDILIASALLLTFIRMEITSAVRTSTRSLLRWLMLLVLASGVVVASTTVLIMVFLLRNNGAYNLFWYSQGRVYALTILCNFLVGIPATQTATSTNAPVTNITGVVFHVDYNSTSHRDAITSNHGSELDADTLTPPNDKSQTHSD